MNEFKNLVLLLTIGILLVFKKESDIWVIFFEIKLIKTNRLHCFIISKKNGGFRLHFLKITINKIVDFYRTSNFKALYLPNINGFGFFKDVI